LVPFSTLRLKTSNGPKANESDSEQESAQE
jgi:hypothetical protein